MYICAHFQCEINGSILPFAALDVAERTVLMCHISTNRGAVMTCSVQHRVVPQCVKICAYSRPLSAKLPQVAKQSCSRLHQFMH
jgi:hypothetical protein